MASVSMVRVGISGALTFQGSFCADSLVSLSSRSPAGVSRVVPCCRAATCMTQGLINERKQMRPAGLAMGEASPGAPRSVTGFLLASSTVIFS